MSKRLSEMYGLNIYTRKGTYVGTVEDIILNLERGEIMRLSLRPFRSGILPEEDVKKVLQSESIGYEEVVNVGDIIIVQKAHPAKEQKTK